MTFLEGEEEKNRRKCQLILKLSSYTNFTRKSALAPENVTKFYYLCSGMFVSSSPDCPPFASAVKMYLLFSHFSPRFKNITSEREPRNEAQSTH